MKRVIETLVLVLLSVVPALAQERPIAGTTVQTTDTSANSLLVGCTVGSTTCTGGIKSGPLVVNAVTVVNSSGQIPAIDSSHFASLSAANLTSIPAANMTGVCCGAATNVALLNASNSFTGASQTIGSGGTGAIVAAVVLSGGSGSGGGGEITFSRNGTPNGFVGSTSAVLGNTSSDIMLYGASGNGIGLYSNGSLRFGVLSAGDFTVGASNHIMFSSGSPVIGVSTFGGAAAPTGNDSSFTITQGAGASAGGDITFGHTFAAAPQCQITMSVNNVGGTPAVSAVNTISTTALNITANVNYVAGTKYYVNCTGT